MFRNKPFTEVVRHWILVINQTSNGPVIVQQHIVLLDNEPEASDDWQTLFTDEIHEAVPAYVDYWMDIEIKQEPNQEIKQEPNQEPNQESNTYDSPFDQEYYDFPMCCTTL